MRSRFTFSATLLFVGVSTLGVGRADDSLSAVVRAGRHVRERSLVRGEVAESSFSEEVRRALAAGPIAIEVRGERDVASPSRGEARIASPGSVRVTWFLPGRLGANEEARFKLVPRLSGRSESPWTFSEKTPGAVGLSLRDSAYFTYNASPVSNPAYSAIQNRDAYIHPAFSPSGALITGDYSKFHPHHRGFFLAYTKTRVGDLHPDFWNIHAGTGKVFHERFEEKRLGPVSASFRVSHRWEAKGKVVLRETWDVETFDVPGHPYRLFDVTASQKAEGEPLELTPYRYGGMAYRGAEPFVKGPIEVLTSEGKHRRDGDQKPARWVDLTGPIADGSETYAGALMADHPSNVNHPTVARIHPTTLPFFCFVPSHDVKVTIGSDQPSIFRYRVMVHDGRPDRERNESIWRDFAEPPEVSIKR